MPIVGAPKSASAPQVDLASIISSLMPAPVTKPTSVEDFAADALGMVNPLGIGIGAIGGIFNKIKAAKPVVYIRQSAPNQYIAQTGMGEGAAISTSGSVLENVMKRAKEMHPEADIRMWPVGK